MTDDATIRILGPEAENPHPPVQGFGKATELFRHLELGSALLLGQPEAPQTSCGAMPGGGADRVYSHHWTDLNDISATLSTLSGAKPSQARFPHVPGYQILAELGRGGMGIVYKARQLGLNRLVALKMILAGDYATDDALSRLLTEAETIARVQHPNIVQVFATGNYEGRPFVELELVEGGSLESRLDGTPWPHRAAARLVEQLARGVSAAHRLGIVHRDLKPANILMTDDGVPKISDFGLAKSLEKNVGLTQEESILGSPNYMSPEQAEGHANQVGPAADVYGLGASLYELLTGRPPFMAPSVLATLELVKNADPVPPRRLQPGLPRDLETICLKCLEKLPSRRYESADDMADDLAAYLKHEPIRARPTLPWERVLKWIRRRPSTAALLFVICLAAAGTVGSVMLYQSEVARQRSSVRHRIGGLHGQVKDLTLLGREAIRRQEWEVARTHLSSALALIQAEPKLVPARASVQSLLGLTMRRIAAEKDRATKRAQFQDFLRLYDEAVFYQSEYTGLDPEASLRASRASARQALAQFALDDENETGPEIDPAHFDKDEQASIISKCYELTVILAEAVAQPLNNEDKSQQAREALKVLDGILRFRQPSAAYHLRRAEYLQTLGDQKGADAERRMSDRVSDPSRSSVDEFLAGERAYLNHDYNHAINAFRRILINQPEHFWAQYLLAVCQLKTHRAAEAQASLIACQSQRPNFVWTYLLKGFAEGEMSEFDLAEADFQRASDLGLGEQGRYVMLVNRGVMRIRRGRNQAAADDLRAAIALKPDQFQAYINLAQALENLNESDAAIDTLNRAIARAPEQAVLSRARSRAHRLRGENKEALEDLDHAIALSAPDDPMLADDHLERGLILQQSGRLQEALAACDRAVALKPDRPDVHRLRGIVLVALKRFEEAIRSFDTCIARGTPSPALYEARGLALFWSGSYDRSIADYTMALNQGKGTASLYANRGWAYLFHGGPELALHDFDRALRIEPANGHALSGRALTYVQLKKPREAVADAHGSVRASPRDARQLYNAARVLCQAAACLDSQPTGANGGWAAAGRYREEGMQLLARSVDSLPLDDRARFWSRVVRTDSALDPIRGARKYLELHARMSRSMGSQALRENK